MQTKEIFSIRKFKTGTHSARLGKVAFASATFLALLSAGQQASAEETTKTTSIKPTVEVVQKTNNPATNLEESKQADSPETVELANQSGTKTGDLTAEINSPTLDQAVKEAKETGVAISEDTTKTYTNITEAKKDLNVQETKVESATNTQKTVDSTIAKAEEKAKEGNVEIVKEASKTYTNNNSAAISDANAQSTVVNQAVQTQSQTTEAVKEAVSSAEKAGVKIETTSEAKYTDVKAAIEDMNAQVTALQKAQTTQGEVNKAIEAAVVLAQKAGITVKEGEFKVLTVEDAKARAAAITAEVNSVIAYNKDVTEKVAAENARLKAEYEAAIASRDAIIASNSPINKANKAVMEAVGLKFTGNYATDKATVDNYNASLKDKTTTETQVIGDKASWDAAVAAAKTSPTYGADGYTASGSSTNFKPIDIGNGLKVVASGSTTENGSKVIFYGNADLSKVIDNVNWGNVNIEGSGTRPVTYGDLNDIWGRLYNYNIGNTTVVREVNTNQWYKIPKLITTADGKAHDGYVKFQSSTTGLLSAYNGSKVVVWNARGAINAIDGGSNPGDRPGDSITTFISIDKPDNNDSSYIWLNLISDLDGGQYTQGIDDSMVLSLGGGLKLTNNQISSNENLGYTYGKNTSKNALNGLVSAPDGTALVVHKGMAKYTLKNTPGGNSNAVVRADFGSEAKVSKTYVTTRTVTITPDPIAIQEPTPEPNNPDLPEEIKPNLKDVTIEKVQVKTQAHNIQMTAKTHDVIIATNIHDVQVTQSPNNVKGVVNEDGTNTNKQLVPKGSVQTWTLTNSNLIGGRETITKYVMEDPFPAGFDIDEDKTVAANKAWEITFDENGKATINAAKATLNMLNANKDVDVAIPQLKFIGSPVNDGGTYQNTFKTTIVTPSGSYTTVSNTPEIYTPGTDDRTYNGSVIVRYFTEEGKVITKIAPDQTDVEDGKVGSTYDTTDQKDEFIAFEGKTYKITSKVVGEENGEVIRGIIYVDYYYELVPNKEGQGNVIVHYVEEEGNKISNDVVDTPDSPTGTEYNTTDNKPNKIVTEDGIEYELVPNKTIGEENGKVTEGTTEVTYVYKRITPKPETPTPNDNVIQPTKVVVDEKGNSINGKSVLPNSVLNYVAKQDFDQYKGISASKASIAKGFVYIDDYLDEALNGKSMKVNSITAANDDDVSKLLEMRHVLSVDSLDEKLKALVKESGISPVGEFYMWVAKDPEAFFEAYLQKGLDITYNLSFEINKSFTEGEITNQTHQIDFGNGYAGNIVRNDLPLLVVHKEVLDKDGKDIDGKTVKLGDEVTYRLNGWVIPAGRGYDIFEYRFVDKLQNTHDEYESIEIVAKVDFELTDGTKFQAGDDLSEYTETVYNAKTGVLETKFKEDFLAKIARDQEFGADGIITVKRIAAGEVVNEYSLFVNGNEVISNKVTTFTPEDPEPTPPTPTTPVTPTTPGTPVTPAVVPTPETGAEQNSGLVASMMASVVAMFGIAGMKKRKED